MPRRCARPLNIAALAIAQAPPERSRIAGSIGDNAARMRRKPGAAHAPTRRWQSGFSIDAGVTREDQVGDRHAALPPNGNVSMPASKS